MNEITELPDGKVTIGVKEFEHLRKLEKDSRISIEVSFNNMYQAIRSDTTGEPLKLKGTVSYKSIKEKKAAIKEVVSALEKMVKEIPDSILTEIVQEVEKSISQNELYSLDRIRQERERLERDKERCYKPEADLKKAIEMKKTVISAQNKEILELRGTINNLRRKLSKKRGPIARFFLG